MSSCFGKNPARVFVGISLIIWALPAVAQVIKIKTVEAPPQDSAAVAAPNASLNESLATLIKCEGLNETDRAALPWCQDKKAYKLQVYQDPQRKLDPARSNQLGAAEGGEMVVYEPIGFLKKYNGENKDSSLLAKYGKDVLFHVSAFTRTVGNAPVSREMCFVPVATETSYWGVSGESSAEDNMVYLSGRLYTLVDRLKQLEKEQSQAGPDENSNDRMTEIDALKKVFLLGPDQKAESSALAVQTEKSNPNTVYGLRKSGTQATLSSCKQLRSEVLGFSFNEKNSGDRFFVPTRLTPRSTRPGFSSFFLNTKANHSATASGAPLAIVVDREGTWNVVRSEGLVQPQLLGASRVEFNLRLSGGGNESGLLAIGTLGTGCPFVADFAGRAQERGNISAGSCANIEPSSVRRELGNPAGLWRNLSNGQAHGLEK